MPTHRTIMWTPWEGPGLEHLELQDGNEGIVADGTMIRMWDGQPVRVHYEVRCDTYWCVRSMRLERSGPAPARLALASDGGGHWTDTHGNRLADLDGCIDVDIMASPFTNTLPIRRLGEAARTRTEIRVAYVWLPELAIRPTGQAYQLLERGENGPHWRYESLDRPFTADLQVDKDGLIIDYPGLARRAWPRRSDAEPTRNGP